MDWEKEIKPITGVGNLLNAIRKIRREKAGCKLYFRGQTKKYPEIQPSIGRDNYLKNEHILFREYILRNPNEFEGENTTFEKLVKMQHYKLPTRLLDISSNPFVSFPVK